MKVTAIIDDKLIAEVKEYSKKSTITEAVTFALREWLDLYHIRDLNDQVREKPLEFSSGFSASSVRELNRKR
ncbi:MAG TPA: type II toxin-antitoxin system VapB family antitoxin [Spirochaetia bacterium]|nr:type II toxin-antitoxin system VapB family antitoxin [Spirochaetia bacterium]